MDNQHGDPGPVPPFAAPGVGTANLPAPPGPGFPGSLDPVAIRASAPPRRFPHVVRFIVALIAWVGVAFGISLIVTDALTRDLYGSTAARDEAFASATSKALLATATWVLVTMALIARTVGYRLRDALFALVPLYGYVFEIRMLWRWTGLPDRPWAERDIQTTQGLQVEPPPRRMLRPADPFIAIMCVLSLVGFVWFTNKVDDTTVAATPDEWVTVRARGMSIDVPKGYIVNTDPAEAAQMLSESGDPVAEDLSELLEQFPNFFVMTAVEPSITEGRSITVFRFPSGGAPLKASARWFAQGAEKSGFELVSEGTTTVGTGAYPAVRFDWVGGPPPPGPSVDFVIDDGPQVWTVGFVMPEGDDVRMAPTIDDVIDSITLPDGRS